MSLHIIILAAGQGKRMYSSKPKVLHTLAGKPMLEHVVDTAKQLHAQKIHIIYGHGGEQVKNALAHLPVHWVLQKEQLGTGHAVMQALPFIPAESQVMILSGDVPLISADTLRQLITQCTEKKTTHQAPLGLLVTHMENPFGMGRILRDAHNEITAIIEEKDANAQQRTIKEIYSGVCCTSSDNLMRWLPKINIKNAQNEYYLTDIIAMASVDHAQIVSHCVQDQVEVQGVNNLDQLQHLERIWQMRTAQKMLLSGVLVVDPSRIDIRGELTCGKDVFIDINSIFEGHVTIGDGSSIGPNCTLTNVVLGEHCKVYANSVLENCHIDNDCHIGPFARLRPGTKLANQCKIGNFVETKNAVLGENSKANHLSYLGDTLIGKNVNIGAGTITCNYDGAFKHQTIIEDDVFIGSDTQLIAPVTIGKNATIGAGTSIRKNVPEGMLAITESKQKIISGWTRPKKS